MLKNNFPSCTYRFARGIVQRTLLLFLISRHLYRRHLLRRPSVAPSSRPLGPHRHRISCRALSRSIPQHSANATVASKQASEFLGSVSLSPTWALVLCWGKHLSSRSYCPIDLIHRLMDITKIPISDTAWRITADLAWDVADSDAAKTSVNPSQARVCRTNCPNK